MFDFRPKVNVTVMQTGESFPCPVGESVLKGMLCLGRKGIPVGCVNGGCGVCKIKIHSGDVTKLDPGADRLGAKRAAFSHCHRKAAIADVVSGAQ